MYLGSDQPCCGRYSGQITGSGLHGTTLSIRTSRTDDRGARDGQQGMVFRSSVDGVGFDVSWSKWQHERTDCVKKVHMHAVVRRACGPAQLLVKCEEQFEGSLETQSSCEDMGVAQRTPGGHVSSSRIKL